MNAILDAVTKFEAVLDGKPAPAAAKPLAVSPATAAKAQQVKSFAAIVADLTAASAEFKALRDAKNAEAAGHAQNIAQHTQLHDAAISVATQADSTAASIDLMLAPLAPLNATAQPTAAPAPAAA